MLANGRVNVEVVTHGHTWHVAMPEEARVLLLEPGVWSRQHYLGAGSALTVLCDSAYDPADYVTELAELR